jgi:hypothetical protein
MDQNLLIALIAAGAVAIICFGALAMAGRQRESKMRRMFGPEYDRMVETAGGRRKATSELRSRAKRVGTLDIKPLTEEERARLIPEWQTIETSFISDPRAAVGSADHLLGKVLGERGYASADFEQQAAEMSVHHPVVVQDYRTAHSIARSEEETNTEDLRQAMLGYRAVFQELVGEARAVH